VESVVALFRQEGEEDGGEEGEKKGTAKKQKRAIKTMVDL